MGSPVWYCGTPQSWECPAGAPRAGVIAGRAGRRVRILSRAGLALSEHGHPPAQPADAQGRCIVNSALNAGSYSGFLYVLTRQTGLLDPGMLVNIQQPLIREDGTVLLATDCKVMSRSHPSPFCLHAGTALGLRAVEWVPSSALCPWYSRAVGCLRSQRVGSYRSTWWTLWGLF